MGIEEELSVAQANSEKAAIAAETAQMAAQTLVSQATINAASEIQEAKNEVENQKGDLEWLKHRVSELESNLATANAQISDLQVENLNLTKMQQETAQVAAAATVAIESDLPPASSADSQSSIPETVEVVAVETAENPTPPSGDADGLKEAVAEVLAPPPPKTPVRKKYRLL